MDNTVNNGNRPEREKLLLYRAAQRGVYGIRREYGKGSITDALFVYLDGEPEQESTAAVETEYIGRPWVCLTEAWEEFIRERFPHAEQYTRYMMKPTNRFLIPEELTAPEGYEIRAMDRTAFDRHPFSHGANYASYDAFRAEGAGAVAYRDGEVTASASSFLSLDGEAELDVSTREEHRGKGLARACTARMLQDCMERGITVHWDAQNEISRHMAERFGFEQETVYTVYWQPEKADLSFVRTGVDSPDARMMLEELNETLTGILGHNGTRHVCLDDFSQEGGFFLVGYDEGAPVCCAGVRRLDATTGEVKRVYARKNRKGIGRALMAALEQYAAEAGYRRLVLECREGNPHAIEFYKKTGYRVCEKYPPYGDEEDAVCLDKQLEHEG